MNEESKPADRASEAKPLQSVIRKGFSWLPVIVLSVAFLTGFAPMWMKSRRLLWELNQAQTALRLETIQLTLATAALDARRGDYEPARLGMVRFFNLITVEFDRGIGSALPSGARADLQPFLARRDDLITLLARSDPAGAERLASDYFSIRKMLVQ